MPNFEQQQRQDIVEVGKLIWQKGWVASNDGNISVRLDERRILATPTGLSKGRMQPEDLIVCDLDGRKLCDAPREGTTEILMHLSIYKLRPDVQAVVHSHAPISTGFATAGRGLQQPISPEVIVGLGCVPLADYGLPGTPALSETLEPYLPHYNAILLANHGLVTYGSNLWQAYYRMETVEHTAHIALVAHLLGGARELSDSEVSKLLHARERYGVPSDIAMPPGMPAMSRNGHSDDLITISRTELFDLLEEALNNRRLARRHSETRR